MLLLLMEGGYPIKLALAVWDKRISPVLDASKRLLVLEMEGGKILSRTEHEIRGDDPYRRAMQLAELGIETLICGAVSRPLAEMMASQGIRLVPFVAGGVEEVLAAFLSGRLPNPALAMPGCCRRGGGGWGWRGGRGCRRGRGGR